MFSPYLQPPTTKATIPVLGNNGNLCKAWSFHPKTWKTSIFGISGGMPKLVKNLGKMDVFSLFATTKAPQVASSYHPCSW
jgi:hypothetical protein